MEKFKIGDMVHTERDLEVIFCKNYEVDDFYKKTLRTETEVEIVKVIKVKIVKGRLLRASEEDEKIEYAYFIELNQEGNTLTSLHPILQDDLLN